MLDFVFQDHAQLIFDRQLVTDQAVEMGVGKG